MILKLNTEETLKLFDYAYKKCDYAGVSIENEFVCLNFLTTLVDILSNEETFTVLWERRKEAYYLYLEQINNKKKLLLSINDDKALDVANKFNLPHLQILFTKSEVITYLEHYQYWRRGGEAEMPDPKTLGYVIDEAIRILKSLSN